MTAEVVNLRRVRKSKLRDVKASDAVANRALFGRTRAERDRQTLETERAIHHLDGHRRDTGADRPDGID